MAATTSQRDQDAVAATGELTVNVFVFPFFIFNCVPHTMTSCYSTPHPSICNQQTKKVSMECFYSSKMIFYLFLLLPLLSLSSHSYDLPNHYFINCGSDSPVEDYQRTFSGDGLFTGDSRTIEETNFTADAELLDIYKTARIFDGKSVYELKVDQNGPYTVRLHFYPFSNLWDAKFNVIASGYSLLSNFSVSRSKKLPVIEEFLFLVNETKLKIWFIPSQDSPFAFANALEAFPAPDNSTPDDAIPLGKIKINGKLSSNVLHVINRINVGGPVIGPKNDTLWRNWVPDHDLVDFPDLSRTSESSGTPNYQDVNAKYYAPDYVYNTARQIKLDGGGNMQHSVSNITWHFGVNNNTPHFIRLHFYDIVSQTRDATHFKLYVYGEFVETLSPYVYDPKAPFYRNYVVNSDASGNMSICLIPLQDSDSKNAFLNGIEVMQLISNVKVMVPDETKQKSKHLLTIIGPVVGGLVLVFVSGVALCFYMKSRKTKPVEASHIPIDQIFGRSTHSHSTDRSVISIVPDMNLGLKVPLEEILFATKNFDPKGMIGEGGFGKVYKGTMRNGVKVAVKRSEPGHGQGLLEFQTEIMVLSKIRHRHLVSLIGYCDERDEMILVYEFMEKGTLREHLYKMNEHPGDNKSESESNSCSGLSWVQRLEICIGAAKGLNYLHTGLTSPIIHRDIKSTNILLDEHYVAKVADFGLSRSGSLDQSYVSTDVKGSFGYLDPDYARCMQLTQKTDVYSFGVVLLEVFCARPALNSALPKEQVNLAEWGMTWQKKGELGKIIDPLLEGKINPSSLRKFGETAEKCLQEDGVDRPRMADVCWDLEYALRLQHPLHPRDDDSTTMDVSLQLPLPVVNRLPSHIMPMSEDEYSQTMNDDTGLGASDVFSQLKVDDAR